MNDPVIPIKLLMMRSANQALWWSLQALIIVIGGFIVLALKGAGIEKAVLPIFLIPIVAGVSAPYQVVVVRSERWVPYFSYAMLVCIIFSSLWAATFSTITIATINLLTSTHEFDTHSILVAASAGFGIGCAFSLLPRDRNRRVMYG